MQDDSRCKPPVGKKALKTRRYRMRVRQDPIRYVRERVQALRAHAKNRGKVFDLDVQWCIEQLEKTEYRCAASGLPLQVGGEAFAPNSLSFDRIDNTGGYTKDNVQIVSYIYNCARNRFTYEDVLSFAQTLLSTHKGK